MRIRRTDRPGLEVKNDCTGCYCHEFPMIFEGNPGYCSECGCPKTPETFDKEAKPIIE